MKILGIIIFLSLSSASFAQTGCEVTPESFKSFFDQTSKTYKSLSKIDIDEEKKTLTQSVILKDRTEVFLKINFCPFAYEVEITPKRIFDKATSQFLNQALNEIKRIKLDLGEEARFKPLIEGLSSRLRTKVTKDDNGTYGLSCPGAKCLVESAKGNIKLTYEAF